MEGQLAAARAHPAVVVSIVIVAVALAAAALVAIAYMLGWVPAQPTIPTPVGIANPAQQSTGIATDLALSPGESVVTPAESPPSAAPPALPKPVTPAYARPPSQKPALASAPAPAKPAPPKPAAPKPSPPKFAGHPRVYCVNCGNISAVTGYGRGEWDVRVRFEDGSEETLRYREPPPFRLGDRVHLEGGTLVRE